MTRTVIFSTQLCKIQKDAPFPANVPVAGRPFRVLLVMCLGGFFVNRKSPAFSSMGRAFLDDYTNHSGSFVISTRFPSGSRIHAS